MADVVLDARMNNKELLGSIDKVLGNMEKKFDASVNNINAKLATIGSNLGQGLISNLNSQLNSAEKKLDELQNKANRSSSSSASTKSININDNNNAIINGFQTQDFGLLQLNEHYRQLEISSKRAAEAQSKIFNRQRADTKMDLSSALKMPTNDIDEVNAKLKRLQELKSKISSSQRPLLNPSEIQGIDTQISNLNKKLEILQAKVKQPLSFNNVMSMPTGNLNDISAKMKAITNLRGQYAANAPELVQLNQAYQRLSNMQKEALTAGVQLEKHNNKLSTSFENLGRRVLFYAGLGALTGFVEQIYDIRGQYEMLERSMGALLGDFAKGSALFNQIQAQALKSPFTVIDLSSAAKQLLAYNFAEGQVADTTKRLADISSALGIPIERLVYNTGQIKAKGFLDSRDARDYANSGLAIVPMLAKLYTEQKRNGEQAVTTSEVYDMMTKKMVSYGDVMAVINKATSDGGMFFDFQAKQAETLKGQMSNLVDAWNLMLNQIGKDNQGVLTGSVSLARTLFTNWREVENVILSLITAYGAYKTSQIVMNTLIGQGNTTITNSIIANKLKMASDLQRASLTRTLTTEENAFLLTRNKVTASDYAAALSTKGLRKEQLLLLATFNMRNTAFLQGLIRSNLLTAAEVRGALSAKGLSLAFNVLTLSAKTLGKSILGLLISNAPMIALTAIVGIISSMVAKHEEYKQKIKDVNDEYNNLRKNIADISVNFKIALLQKDNKGIDEARNQLNELIKLSKEQYNITFNIDTSKLNPKQIVETFNQIKNELDNLSIASRQFADSAIESNLGDTWDKYGQSIGKVYDIISSNKSVVVDALQSHINKLKQLGGSQKEIQDEQQILNSLMTPKKENESQIDYLNRLVGAYNQLGIIGSNTDLFDKSTDQLRKLGIAGDETFKTLNTDWSELMSTGEDATKAFNSQIDELAKRINLNALPKEQRTLQLEAAINKFATDKNLNEWSRETMLRLANEKYHTTIKIVDDKPSEDKTEFDIKSWQGRLQNWANRNKIVLGLTLTVETTEVQAAQEALQKVQAAQEAVEIVKRKIKQGTASAVDLDAAKKNYKQQLEIAKAAGSDLSSLNKKADSEKRKAEAAQKKALSEEAQAIKNEIDLIDKLSSNYDKLTKAGMSSTDAISLLNNEYKNSISAINSVLGKYKLPDFNVKEFAGKDVSGQLDYLEKLRNAMKTKGLDKLKPDAFKEVSVQIQKIKVEGKVYDLTKITDGLQESLSNIKESYELGIEIEANPELGNMFASMFKIDTSTLPKTARDAINLMQEELNKAIKSYNEENKTKLGNFDILSTQLTGKDNYADQFGISNKSDLYKILASSKKQGQDLIQKEFAETEKILNEYLSKDGDFATKSQNIEKERLQNIKKLNDLYNTDSLRSQQIYIDKLNAINTGANREKATAAFDQFKNSDLYTKMFENLNYASTSTLTRIKNKLEDLKTSMQGLSPEQLKQIVEQEDKINTELTSRNPFKGLMSNIKDYISSLKSLKENEKNAINAQEEYDSQENVVAALKEKIALNEANGQSSSEYQRLLEMQLSVEQKILLEKRQNLDIASQQVTKAEALMKKLGKQLSGAANKMQEASQAASSIRDDLKSVGVDLGDNVNAAIDGFSKASEGVSTMVQSLISGNIAGVISGGVKAVVGQYQMISAIFGGNKKDYFTKLKASVDALAQSIKTANDDLTKLLENSAGSQAYSYYKKIIKNNKELEDSYRRIAEKAGMSGSGWGSHSYAYRTNEALSGYWTQISNLVGKPISSIQQMYNLSSDELKLVRDNMPDAWNSVSSEIRTALESVIEYGTSAQDALDQVQKAVTEIDLSDLESAFSDMLSNLDTDSYDVAQNFQKYMRNAIVRTLVYGESFQTQMKAWMAAFTSDMQDGSLSATEKAILQSQFNTMTKNAQEKVKAALAAAGLDTTSTTELSSLQQGIQSMTEDTGGALESYMNGISGQVYLHTTQLQQLLNNSNVSLGVQSQILLALQNGYQIQQSIQSILAGWSSSNGRSVKVELLK